MKRLLILSTSQLHNSGYLAYAIKPISEFFTGIKEITFIPFAQPSGISFDDYTRKAREFFTSINIELKGIHEKNDFINNAIKAEAFFIGGGNTFLLLKTLYETGIFQLIKEKVEGGIPYMGTSAGSNLTGQSINTTNDMPIVYPPSFESFGFIPYNLNPHYVDPDPHSTHMGETRETRINEFHAQANIPVIGLREGSFLNVTGDNIILKGEYSARLFEKNKSAVEKETGYNFKVSL